MLGQSRYCGLFAAEIGGFNDDDEQCTSTALFSKMSARPKKKTAAQKAITLEYNQHTTPTRNQITGVFTTLAATKTWIIKRGKEVRPMNVCSAWPGAATSYRNT